MTHLCRLHLATGRVDECPQAWCPFWDRDGCAFEALKLEHTHVNLAAYLLEVRTALETTRDREELRKMVDELGSRLPPGLR